MFTKRTIKPHEAVTKVDTASEALSVSLAEKACVDMDYMCSLTGKSAEEIEHELSGVIFRVPEIRKSQRESVLPWHSEDHIFSERNHITDLAFSAVPLSHGQSNLLSDRRSTPAHNPESQSFL